MKKRKLSLYRETLRSLSGETLQRVDGAGETYEFISGCACTDSCVTCNGCNGGGGGGGGPRPQTQLITDCWLPC